MDARSDDTVTSDTMEAYFTELVSTLDGNVGAGEIYTCRFAAEISDFVRFNRGRVRQPGSVEQRVLDIDWMRGARHATHTLTLSGHLGSDRAAVIQSVALLRATLADVTDDPHLLIASDVVSSHATRGGPLPPVADIVTTVLDAAKGQDLVGFYAGGPVYRGFANASGQRNWHAVTSCNLQWSLYHRADKAVKSALSGLAWDAGAFIARMNEAKEQLARVGEPPKALAPGSYRAFLAPAAMEEIASLLGWGSFSARALATRQSPLLRMQGATDAAARLDPRVSLAEVSADGVAPAFQGDGFTRPARIPLIDAGRLIGSLTSPRSAREFGLAVNGANGAESPESLTMAGGDLAAADALSALDTGLYIGNLWYLNFSDRPACRMTGMTRFATFWVERGRIVAPVDVARFDDTLYRMLGDNLEALTRETELTLCGDTYGERQLTSMRLPGALLKSLAFTL